MRGRTLVTFGMAFALGGEALAQLNQNCTISVLNRTVQANPDGSWVLPNVPAGMGQVKARATCVNNGVTQSGESTFFSVSPNTAVNLPDIVLGSATQIPVSLSITPNSPTLTAVGQSLQLAVTAQYPDNSIRNVTAASTGTNYTTSNPAIASVAANGLVTALASGTVVIQAINDGTPAMLTARVVLSGRDTDGDGIADDVEVANGLNPNNPVDAMEDFDRDNLTNAQELARGTNLRKADTDDDGLLDGDEVTRSTNPLLSDTDGDRIPDGVEVATGTNPLDRGSYDLRRSAASFSLTPGNFVLTTSLLVPQATAQLAFRVTLIDGKTTLDLTARSTGTSYSSSSISTCNFGAEDGLVFAGQPGTCLISATNNTLTVTTTGTVQTFSPRPLSFVSVPGTAMNVDISGNYAFVAAGAAGLVVVEVTDRANPRVVTTIDTPGFANDVTVAGNFAYVADGLSGLRIYNITNPVAPIQVGVFDTPGDAQDVVVRGTMALVADGAQGLQILNVTNPATPVLAGSRTINATAIGVDYDPNRQLVAIAAGSAGLVLLNVANPASPVIVGSVSGGDVRDVALSGNYAFLADMSRSFTPVDITNPSAPILRTSTPASTGGLLEDVVLFGSLAFGADLFFVNDVPIIDVSNPATPTPRLLLPFRSFRDDNGTGIAVDRSHVYLTANVSDGRLYIGEWALSEDRLGVPPQVSITSPANGSNVVQGATVAITANAVDDVAVASVAFSANSQQVSIDYAAPFEASVVASALGPFTINAAAVDFGGNTGSAQVTVNVIPDPLTTATGRVLDSTGVPVSGASVSALGRTTTSLANGAFSLAGLPTVSGPIIVTAIATIGAVPLGGSSNPVSPVPGGLMNVGDIRIYPRPTITGVRRKGVLAGTTVPNFAVDGTNFFNVSFSVTPVLDPPAIAVIGASLSPTGVSASLTLNVSPNAAGAFVLVATNPGGTSDTTASQANTITVLTDPNADSDGDGLGNAQESQLGTDLLGADTDGDGFSDGREVASGSDPLNATCTPLNCRTAGEVSGVTLSVLNTALPLSRFNEASQTATFSLLNRVLPPTRFNEANGVTFSVLNYVLPPLRFREVNSTAFSVMNTNQPLSRPNEADSVTFSVCNKPSAGCPGFTRSSVGASPLITRRQDAGSITGAALLDNPLIRAPRVEFVSPSEQGGVRQTDAPISLFFSEPMDLGTLSDSLAILANGKELNFAISFSSDFRVATLRASLPAGAEITVVARESAKSLLGVPLIAMESRFRTARKDSPGPKTNQWPVSGAANVGSESTVILENGGTEARQLRLMENGQPKEGVFEEGGPVRVRPVEGFSPGAVVQILLPDIHDGGFVVAGNSRALLTPVRVHPASSNEFDRRGVVEVEFSHPLDSSTVNGERLQLWREVDSSLVEVSILVRGDRTVRVVPVRPLEPETAYVLQIEPTLSATDGQLLGFTFKRQLVTSKRNNSVQPAILEVSPKQGAKNVGPAAPVHVRSNRSINPLTVTSETIRLTVEDLGTLAASVSFSTDFKELMISALQPLPTGRRITVQISGIEDAEGSKFKPTVFHFDTARARSAAGNTPAEKRPNKGLRQSTGIGLALGPNKPNIKRPFKKEENQ